MKMSASKSVKLLPLEHQVLREARRLKLNHAKLLVAVSGGLDSVALLNLLFRLKPLLKWDLTVIHVHHGAGTKKTMQYRNQAQALVKKKCTELNLPLITNTPEKVRLKSEAELRDYRLKHYQKALAQLDSNAKIVTAHHLDDLLETQLLRLIRGSSLEGLKAMQGLSTTHFRPLLQTTRQELEVYAKALKLNFIEDPSNKDTEPFRNWLRHKWLPLLERRQSGSVRRLGLSLELILREFEAVKPQALSGAFFTQLAQSDLGKIKRPEFRALSLNQKKSLLVNYLRAKNVKNYSQNHIEELIKRFDTRQKDYTFTLLKLEWRVSSEHIWTA
jgi:tRNA(Ile)-lysidine synthase